MLHARGKLRSRFDEEAFADHGAEPKEKSNVGDIVSRRCLLIGFILCTGAMLAVLSTYTDQLAADDSALILHGANTTGGAVASTDDAADDGSAAAEPAYKCGLRADGDLMVGDRSIVFIHCPKNGGSVMTNAVRSLSNEPKVPRGNSTYPRYCSAHARPCGNCIGHPHPGYAEYNICLYSDTEVPRFNAFGFKTKDRPRPGMGYLDSMENAWYFFILRDPIVRTLSEYTMCGHRGRCWDYNAGKELTVEEFASLDRGYPFQSRQTRMMCSTIVDPLQWSDDDVLRDVSLEEAKRNLCEIPFFGLHERLPETLTMMSYYFNSTIVIPEKGRYQQHPNITKATRAVIAENNAEDVALYEFGARVFEERWQEFRRRHPAFAPHVRPEGGMTLKKPRI